MPAKRPSPFQGVGQGPAAIPSQVSMGSAGKAPEGPLTGLGDFFENFSKTYEAAKSRQRAEALQTKHEEKREQRATEREAIKERAAVESIYSLLGPMEQADPSLFEPGLNTSAMGSKELMDLLNITQTKQAEQRGEVREEGRFQRGLQAEEARNARELREKIEGEQRAEDTWEKHRARLEADIRGRPTKPTAGEARTERETALRRLAQRKLAEVYPGYLDPKKMQEIDRKAAEDLVMAYEDAQQEWHYGEDEGKGGRPAGIRRGPGPSEQEKLANVSSESSQIAAQDPWTRSWSLIDFLKYGPGGKPMAQPSLPGAPPAPGVAPSVAPQQQLGKPRVTRIQ